MAGIPGTVRLSRMGEAEAVNGSGIITRPLPRSLCDALAARIDAIPRKPVQAQASVKLILQYCEGALDYEALRKPDGMWMRLAAHPALGLTGKALSAPPWELTQEEFQLRYAPELALVRHTADLLARSSREEFDAELASVLESYINTPSPRREEERLKCLVQNRAADCPLELETFLWALWQGGRTRIFETSRQAVHAMDGASPEARAILAESYSAEAAMARACLDAAVKTAEGHDRMEAEGLEPGQVFDRWRRDLLRTYAAIRVRRSRLLTRLGQSGEEGPQ